MLYWLLKRVMLGPLLKFLFRPRVEGAEHVPARGPAILASNHLSFSDSIFLPLVLSRRVTFPAKLEYFTGTGVTGQLKAMFVRGTGQIPIDRSGGDASRLAMDAGQEILRRGELFGIYPEGTRSPDGRLYRGKTGVARLALETGAPIVPVAMIDTDKAQPTGQKIPNIVRVGVRFGAPRDYSPFAGGAADPAVLRTVTDDVMAEIARLSGQEYVDEYAATRKAQLAAKAEAMLTAAKAESAAAAAKAEELIAAAKAETQSAAAKGQELAARTRTDAQAATARAEDFVTRTKARARGVDAPAPTPGTSAHDRPGPAASGAKDRADRTQDRVVGARPDAAAAGAGQAIPAGGSDGSSPDGPSSAASPG